MASNWSIRLLLAAMILIAFGFMSSPASADGFEQPRNSSHLGPENGAQIEAFPEEPAADDSVAGPAWTQFLPVYSGTEETGNRWLQQIRAVNPEDSSLIWLYDIALKQAGITEMASTSDGVEISAQKIELKDVAPPVVAADGTVFIVERFTLTQKETYPPRTECRYPPSRIIVTNILWPIKDFHDFFYPCTPVVIDKQTVETVPATYNRVTAIDPEGKLKWQRAVKLKKEDWLERYGSAGWPAYFSDPVIQPDGSLHLGTHMIQEKCPAQIRLPEWKIVADSCSANPDGTYYLSGNVTINDELYYTSGITVDKRNKQFTAENGNLYMITYETEQEDADGAAVVENRQSLMFQAAAVSNPKVQRVKRVLANANKKLQFIDENIMTLDGQELRVRQRIYVANYPFTITKLRKNDDGNGVVADLETEVLGRKIQVSDVGITKEGIESFSLSLVEEGKPFTLSKHFTFDTANLEYEKSEDGNKLTITGKISLTNKLWPIKDISGTLGFANRKVDALGLEAGFEPGIPIPNTLAALSRLGLNVSNLTADPSAPITYNGVFDIEGGKFLLRGKPVLSAEQIRIVMDTSPSVELSGNLMLFDYDLSNTTAKWNPKTGLNVTAELDILEFITGETSFNVNSNGLRGSIEATVKFPDSILETIPLSKAVLGNLYLNATGSIDHKEVRTVVTLPLDLKYGATYNFSTNSWEGARMQGLEEADSQAGDGSISYGTNLKRIGQENLFRMMGLPNEIFIDQPYGQVAVGVSWDSGDGEVTLVAPNGERITATTAETRQGHMGAVLMDGFALFVIDSPEQGATYKVEYDENLLSGVAVESYSVNSAPEVSLADVRYDRAAQSVTVDWQVADPDSAPGLKLYYAAGEAENGVPIFEELLPAASGNGSYTWDVSSLPTGMYWIYAEADDGSNVPVRANAAAPIMHIRGDAPEAPQGLQAVARNGGLDLQWNESLDASEYAVTVLAASDGKPVLGFRANGVQTVHIPKGTIAPGSYTVQIEAVKFIGESDESHSAPASVSATVMEARPPAVELAWSNPSGRTINKVLTLTAAVPEGTTIQVYHQDQPIRGGLTGSVEEAFELIAGVNQFKVFAIDRDLNEADWTYDIYFDDMPPVIHVDSMSKTKVDQAETVTILGRTDPGSRVTVNSQTFTADETGSFTATAPFTGHGMEIRIEAVSPRGLSSSKTVMFHKLIADPQLELAIRQALSKFDGYITEEDLQQLERLAAPSQGIQDLSGLEQAVHLKTLDLSRNRLRDIGVLLQLPELQDVNLYANPDLDFTGNGAAGQVKLALENRMVRVGIYSDNADLSDLVLSRGVLTPSFVSDTPNYSVQVEFAASEITLTPTAADSSSRIKINGAAAESGQESPAIPLSVGNNPIVIQVSAEDGQTFRTYKVNVVRQESDKANLKGLTVSGATLAPAFSPDMTHYVALAGANGASVRITATTADSEAVLLLDGQPISSGESSGELALEDGKKLINIQVSGSDGSVKTYSVGIWQIDRNYEAGGYDESAVQPTAFGWSRQSRFTGQAGTKPVELWSVPASLGSPVIGADGTIYAPYAAKMKPGGTIVEPAGLRAYNRDGSIKWIYAYGSSMSLPVIGSDGTIYVVADGGIKGLNPGDGKVKQEIHSNAYSISTAPAIGPDGTIYIAAQMSYGTAPSLLAYNPDGTEKWRYLLNQSMSGTTLVIDSEGTVYFTTYSKLVAVNPSGSLKWEKDVGVYNYQAPMPTLSGDMIYLSIYNKLYAIHKDGTEQWRFFDGVYLSSSAAVGMDGTIYVGSSFREDGIYEDSSLLYALNPDGTVKWSYATRKGIYSTPIIGADGTVYFNSNDGYLYALNGDGALRWKIKDSDFGFSLYERNSPAIGSDGVIYSGNRAIGAEVNTNPSLTDIYVDSTAYGLETNGSHSTIVKALFADGGSRIVTDLASFQSADPLVATVSPHGLVVGAGAGQTEITVTYDGKTSKAVVTVVGGESSVPPFSQGDGYQAGAYERNAEQPAAAGWTHQSRFATKSAEYEGEIRPYLLWSAETPGRISTSPILDKVGAVYVGTQNSRLYSIHPDEREEQNWSYRATGYIQGSPAASANGFLYFHSTDGKIYSLRKDGTLEWETHIGGSISDPVIGADGTIYVGSSDWNLYALYPDGTLKWEFATWAPIQTSPAIAANGTIYVSSNDSNVYALNPDGTELWSLDIEGAPQGLEHDITLSTPVIGGDGTIYVSGPSYLYAIRPDGVLKWKSYYEEYEFRVKTPALSDSGNIYVTTRGHVISIDRDGTLIWKKEMMGPEYSQDLTSPVIAADGTILVGADNFGAGGELYALLPDGSIKWRYQMGGISAYYDSMPMIGRDGVIYVAEDLGDYQGKLLALGEMTLQSITPNATDTELGTGVTYSLNVQALYADGEITETVDVTDKVLYVSSNPDVALVSEQGIVTAAASGTAVITASYGGKSVTIRIAAVDLLPIGELENPTEGEAVHGTVFVEGWFLDPDQVAQIEVLVDQVKAGTALYGLPHPAAGNANPMYNNMNGGFRYKLNTRLLANGTHTITIRETSSEGVPTELVPRTIQVSNDWTQPENAFNQNQGVGGFQPGLYDLEAMQPTAHNWTRQSRYTGVEDPETLWKFDTSYGAQSSPVIGADGTVYSIFYNGTLHALRQDGSLKWEVQLSPYTIEAPAIGEDGTIYAISNNDGKLFAINETGTIIWSIQLSDHLVSSPVIAGDGTIYAASRTHLYAVNPDGSKYWEYKLQGQGLIAKPVIGKDGTIYVGSMGNGYYNDSFEAINPNGTRKWVASYSIVTAPVIGSDGTIYAINYSQLVAINPDGSLKWTASGLESSLSGGPAIGSDGTLYVWGTAGYSRTQLFAVNPDGSLKWSYDINEFPYSAPPTAPLIGADGTIYFGVDKLYALNADGTLKWAFEPEANPYYGSAINTSPAMAQDGTLYFGSQNRFLYALGMAVWSRITVEPSSLQLEVGSSRTIAVTAVKVDGTEVNATAEAVYSSSNPAIARVIPGGTITAAAPGQVTITVTYMGKTAELLVIVTDPGFNPDLTGDSIVDLKDVSRASKTTKRSLNRILDDYGKIVTQP